MNYNEKFINEYQEEVYLKYLRDTNLLNKLIVNFNNRYLKDKEVNGRHILFQESLNNYVIKKIKTDPQFIYTDYFKNYKQYLQEGLKYNTSFFFNNNFFRAFSHEELKNFLGNDIYNQILKGPVPRINVLQEINQRIARNEELTQQELNFVCDVYAFNHDNNQYHEELIKYIFQNLTKQDSQLVCNEYVLDAILAYIPKYYPAKDGYNPLNSRIVADDGHVKVATSFGSNYILFNRDVFKNINFKSIDDIKKTYVKKGSDFTFLMVVANHELSHQYQDSQALQATFSNEGYMSLKKQLLSEKLCDYGLNHDGDDIEIDATEKSWEVCQKFYNDYIVDNNLKAKLTEQCNLNKIGTGNRRFSYMKKDQKTNTEMFAPFYDVSHINNIIYDNPQLVKRYPMLKTFYKETGDISLDYLKKDSICIQSVPADYFCFTCINYPRKVLNYLNHLPEKDLNTALLNIDYAFNKYKKAILYFEYNKNNNLASEHKSSDTQKDDKTLLLESYKIILKLYNSLKFIYSDQELLAKQVYIQSHQELIERNMQFAEELFQKYNNNLSGTPVGPKR